jgi:hypothetical protein
VPVVDLADCRALGASVVSLGGDMPKIFKTTIVLAAFVFVALSLFSAAKAMSTNTDKILVQEDQEVRRPVRNCRLRSMYVGTFIDRCPMGAFTNSVYIRDERAELACYRLRIRCI